MRVAVSAAAVCLSIVGLSVAQDVSAAIRMRTEIPAQDLGSALQMLAQSRDLQVLYFSELVKDVRTGGASGELTVEEALTQLLSGTGLTFRFVDDRAITILPVTTSQPPASPPEARHGSFWSRLRLAQSGTSASQGNAGDAPSVVNASTDSAPARETQVEEIVVTGTHIRQVEKPTSPVFTYDRAAIDRTGYTNVQDFIQSLPQNFTGGALASNEAGLVGGAVSANNEAATSVNLRGLGEGSTLVLLNGRRLAPSMFGAFVDISLIPLASIERIDVLTDGASAVYGSDAVAGVVNFILRKDYAGAQTSVRYGTVTSGDLTQTTISQAYGTNWGSGGVMASLQYNHQEELPSSQRSFTADVADPVDLLPRYTKNSGIVSAYQWLTPRLKIFADGFWVGNRNARDARLGPQFGNSRTRVRNDGSAVTAGLSYDIGGDWVAELSASYSGQQTDLYFEEVDPPPPSYVPGMLAAINKAHVASYDLKLDGSLMELPGGVVKGAFGGGWRKERGRSDLTFFDTSYRRLNRDVTSAFAELYVPLAGAQNARPGLHRLVLSASARYDDYSDFGSSTNPKIGLLYSPLDALDLRIAWGTSFRAPHMQESLDVARGLTAYVEEKQAPGGGNVRTLVLSNVHGVLQPEEARSWTFGFDYRLPFAEGAQLSFNYYDLDYRNRLVVPPSDATVLLSPEVYGALITPLADDAAAEAYLQALVANGATFIDDPMQSGVTGVRYVYDGTRHNAATSRQSGYDVSLSYPFRIGENGFDARLAWSVIEKIEFAFRGATSTADLVNTINNPLKSRIRADLSWSRAGWTINGALNYQNSYTNTRVFPHAPIDSHATFDLTARYVFVNAPAGSLLEGLSLTLSGINVLDDDPPFAEAVGSVLPGVNFDSSNADPRGRFVAFEVRKSW